MRSMELGYTASIVAAALITLYKRELKLSSFIVRSLGYMRTGTALGISGGAIASAVKI